MTNRRSFIRAAVQGTVLAAISAKTIDAQAAPTDGAGARAPQPLWSAKKFTPELLGNWPSDVDQHLALYEGYVKKANELWSLIQKCDRDAAKQSAIYSELRELKVEYSFAVGGVRNHELYFGHLLNQPRENNRATGSLLRALNDNFGSFEQWELDLKATAISARGWVWLGLDLEKATLFNYIGDSQNTYPVWGITPILALDMYEHAYFKDYGRNRVGYIGDFLKRVDWGVVVAHFERISHDGQNSHK